MYTSRATRCAHCAYKRWRYAISVNGGCLRYNHSRINRFCFNYTGRHGSMTVVPMWTSLFTLPSLPKNHLKLSIFCAQTMSKYGARRLPKNGCRHWAFNYNYSGIQSFSKLKIIKILFKIHNDSRKSNLTLLSNESELCDRLKS